MKFFELNESFLGRFETKTAMAALKKHPDDAFAEIVISIHSPRKFKPERVRDALYAVASHFKCRADANFEVKMYTTEFSFKVAGSVLRLKMVANAIADLQATKLKV